MKYHKLTLTIIFFSCLTINLSAALECYMGLDSVYEAQHCPDARQCFKYVCPGGQNFENSPEVTRGCGGRMSGCALTSHFTCHGRQSHCYTCNSTRCNEGYSSIYGIDRTVHTLLSLSLIVLFLWLWFER